MCLYSLKIPEMSPAIRAFPTRHFSELTFHILLAICIRFSDFLPIEFLSDTELAFMMKISKIHIPLSIFVLLTKNDSLLSAVIGLMVGHSSPFITNIEEVKANWIFLDMNIKI